MILRYLSGGLAFVALMLGLALYMERRSHAKTQERVIELSAELRRISSTRNEQKEATERTIEKVRIVYRDAEKQAERIETAPLPGQCRTPDAIMDAGL